MRTEAQRSFDHGFVLSEQELRRVVDLATQQIEKAVGTAPGHRQFEIRFRNGAISTTHSIDDVLAQENMGSGAILRLEVSISSTEKDPAWSIQITFIDADRDEGPRATSVHYKITGSERDWVFVTSSLLEERIRRVRRYSPSQLLGRKRFGALITPIVVLGFAMFGVFISSGRQQQAQLAVVDSLATLVHNGRAIDPADAMLAVERVRITTQAEPGRMSIYNPFVLSLGVLGGLVVIVAFWTHFFPIYNFNWGDYLAHFDRRQTVGRFILGGVILAIILGIVANFASRKLGL